MMSCCEQNQNLIKLYRKATEAFLLRDYDTAYPLCTKAIASLNDSTIITTTTISNNDTFKKELWCLYVNLVASLLSEKSSVNVHDLYLIRFLKLPPEIVAEEIWKRVIVEGFDNEESRVPGEIVIS